MQNRMMITGAGSGLGREIALRWAREGWQLALSDVSEPGLQETLKLVREAGGDGFIQRCDVRDYSQLTAFAQACEVKLGGIDVIVNNAGVASGGFFSELSLEDWDWQIAINLMGVVKGCKAFLPLLEKKQRQDHQHRVDGCVDARPGHEQLQRGQGGRGGVVREPAGGAQATGSGRSCGVPVVFPD